MDTLEASISHVLSTNASASKLSLQTPSAQSDDSLAATATSEIIWKRSGGSSQFAPRYTRGWRASFARERVKHTDGTATNTKQCTRERVKSAQRPVKAKYVGVWRHTGRTGLNRREHARSVTLTAVSRSTGALTTSRRHPTPPSPSSALRSRCGSDDRRAARHPFRPPCPPPRSS